ncbi:MAG TPA: PilZ domain-containing protein [Gammaproteobacteria bacterium]
MTEDSRLFTRIPFEANVHITSAEGTWDCSLIDISLKGILASRPDSWSGVIDDPFLVELELDGGEASIRMDVSVAHVEDHHIGFRCEHIDLDSITHLRRLVELNVGDTDILNRELNALGR